MEDNRANHAQAMVIRRMDTIDNLAMAAFKGLTIINGGAIVALFALLAQGSESPFVAKLDVRYAIVGAAAFASGLLFILTANVLGYFGQQAIHGFEQEALEARLRELEATPPYEPDDRQIDRGNRLLHIGGFFAALSLVAFFAGCTFTIIATLSTM